MMTVAKTSAEATAPSTGNRDYCPRFQATMELIGRRWSASILRTLLSGSHRFCEISTTIPGISHRLVSERLGELIDAGLVEADGTGKRVSPHRGRSRSRAGLRRARPLEPAVDRREPFGPLTSALGTTHHSRRKIPDPPVASVTASTART